MEWYSATSKIHGLNTNEASSYLQAASPHAGSYASQSCANGGHMEASAQQNIPVSSNTFLSSVGLVNGR